MKVHVLIALSVPRGRPYWCRCNSVVWFPLNLERSKGRRGGCGWCVEWGLHGLWVGGGQWKWQEMKTWRFGRGKKESKSSLEGRDCFLGLGKHGNTSKKKYFPSNFLGYFYVLLRNCFFNALTPKSWRGKQDVMENEKFRNVGGNARNSQEYT